MEITCIPGFTIVHPRHSAQKTRKTVAEVSAQDIFGSPQPQLAPEVPKEPIAEVSAQDIFGIPDSEVQLAPDRYQQRSNLVPEDNQHGEISVDDLFGLN